MMLLFISFSYKMRKLQPTIFEMRVQDVYFYEDIDISHYKLDCELYKWTQNTAQSLINNDNNDGQDINN